MKKILILISVLLLSACGEEVKTSEWWFEHHEEAVIRYKKCLETGEDTPNCENIHAIDIKIAKVNPEMLRIIEEKAKNTKEKFYNN